MRIDEIRWGHFPKNPNIDPHLVPNTTLLGKYEIYDIHQFEFGNYSAIAIMNDDGTYKGYTLCQSDGTHVIPSESYVKPEFRRMGILSCITLFILRELNHSILIRPDEIVTDDSRSVFYSLASRGKIKIRSSLTNNVLTTDEIGKLFRDIEDNDVGLIIESKRVKQIFERYEIVNPVSGLAEIPEAIYGSNKRPRQWYD